MKGLSCNLFPLFCQTDVNFFLTYSVVITFHAALQIAPTQSTHSYTSATLKCSPSLLVQNLTHGCNCKITPPCCPPRQHHAEDDSLFFIGLFYRSSQQLWQLQPWSSLACFHRILRKLWHLISLREMGFERWGTRVAKLSSPLCLIYSAWAAACKKKKMLLSLYLFSILLFYPAFALSLSFCLCRKTNMDFLKICGAGQGNIIDVQSEIYVFAFVDCQ